MVWGRGQILGWWEGGRWLKVARARENGGKDLGDRAVGPGQATAVMKAGKRVWRRKLSAV